MALFSTFLSHIDSSLLFSYRFPTLIAGLMSYLYFHGGKHMSSFGLSRRSVAKHLFRCYLWNVTNCQSNKLKLIAALDFFSDSTMMLFLLPSIIDINDRFFFHCNSDGCNPASTRIYPFTQWCNIPGKPNYFLINSDVITCQMVQVLYWLFRMQKVWSINSGLAKFLAVLQTAYQCLIKNMLPIHLWFSITSVR